MKSQIILAIFLALCLSNTSSSSEIPRSNITSLGQVKSILEDLQKQPDGKDILKNLTQFLELIIRNMNSTTNESQSESLLPRTGSVPGTETKSSTTAPQPTDSVPGDKSKPSTQKPDKQVSPTTQTTTGNGNKPSPPKKPVKQVSPTTQTTTENVPEIGSKHSPPKKPVKQASPTIQTTPESAPEIGSKHSPPKKPVKQASPTQPTTQSVPGNESSSSTKITTKEAPPTLNTTISVPVNGTNSSSVNDTKIAAAAGGNQSNATDTSQRDSTQSFQQSSSNFPVIFMVILVAVLGVYFAYHNRSKIHRFIKEGYSKAAKQSGTGYVKVKVDDDIELPREANRQYVY